MYVAVCAAAKSAAMRNHELTARLAFQMAEEIEMLATTGAHAWA